MLNELTVDRDAIVEIYRAQNLQILEEAVKKGRYTQNEASLLHAAFMASSALQRAVDSDVERLEAHLAGRVH